MVAFVLSAVVAFYALRFGDVFTQEGIQLLFLELTGAGVTLMCLLNVNSKHSLFTKQQLNCRFFSASSGFLSNECQSYYDGRFSIEYSGFSFLERKFCLEFTSSIDDDGLEFDSITLRANFFLSPSLFRYKKNEWSIDLECRVGVGVKIPYTSGKIVLIFWLDFVQFYVPFHLRKERLNQWYKNKRV